MLPDRRPRALRSRYPLRPFHHLRRGAGHLDARLRGIEGRRRRTVATASGSAGPCAGGTSGAPDGGGWTRPDGRRRLTRAAGGTAAGAWHGGARRWRAVVRGVDGGPINPWDKGIPIPPYPQEPGDPAAGYEYLTNAGYFGCGVPARFFGLVQPFATLQGIPANRFPGRNADRRRQAARLHLEPREERRRSGRRLHELPPVPRGQVQRQADRRSRQRGCGLDREPGGHGSGCGPARPARPDAAREEGARQVHRAPASHRRARGDAHGRDESGGDARDDFRLAPRPTHARVVRHAALDAFPHWRTSPPAPRSRPRRRRGGACRRRTGNFTTAWAAAITGAA